MFFVLFLSFIYTPSSFCMHSSLLFLLGTLPTRHVPASEFPVKQMIDIDNLLFVFLSSTTLFSFSFCFNHTYSYTTTCLRPVMTYISSCYINTPRIPNVPIKPKTLVTIRKCKRPSRNKTPLGLVIAPYRPRPPVVNLTPTQNMGPRVSPALEDVLVGGPYGR